MGTVGSDNPDEHSAMVSEAISDHFHMAPIVSMLSLDWLQDSPIKAMLSLYGHGEQSFSYKLSDVLFDSRFHD